MKDFLLKQMLFAVLFLFVANSIAAQSSEASNELVRLSYDLSGYHWKIQGTLPGRGLEVN